MIDQLAAAFNFGQQAVALRQERHEVLASNIANADTPNYLARDFDFASQLKQAVERGRSAEQEGLNLARTSARHIEGQGPPLSGSSQSDDLLYRMPAQPSLDGNTVEMDQERMQFIDNAVRYETGLTLVNRRVQGLKGAMQPE
ncbi:flagellar basal body rod protein FlgB [Lamprobacter modestohalophilus]|uniref:Flagellar basal body rod protein FlgB n=1 Tax=Lamprobacter modestohalophilus TaxID=1064514 RepID=A0A9X1B447_9GAMM|nr:flagellar basal body rod protein FlgB [Lamprobacter modestohalophilus]MBK1618376.1 flagellar basal body rod protein FlgB [Lamprobacter modestohalophilus]